MPIYEYACQKCGHQFEALQKVSEGALKKCPACGELRLKRLVSAPQFRLKGSGWYETDFKKDGKKRLADGGEAPPADSPQAAPDEKGQKGDKGEKGGKAAAAGAGKAGDGAKAGTGTKKPAGAGTDKPAKPAGGASAGGAD